MSHPISTRYRLRGTYRNPSASGSLEGTAGITSIHQLPPRVVINEFRTRGPNGTADQFVELFNDSLTASNASLNLCASSNDVLAPNCVGLPAITIGPFCHYLIAGPRYSGSVRGDLSVSAMLYDDGYLTIIPTFAAFTQSDTVGMNARVSSNYEGAPLTPFDASNTDRSYVRTGTDTNHNERDFVMRSPSSPQNAAFCGSR